MRAISPAALCVHAISLQLVKGGRAKTSYMSCMLGKAPSVSQAMGMVPAPGRGVLVHGMMNDDESGSAVPCKALSATCVMSTLQPQAAADDALAVVNLLDCSALCA